MQRKNPAPILYAEETDSTNLALRRLAAEGAADGTVLWAARQTAGRGRLGRSFSSPEGGLYLSMLLSADDNMTRDLNLTPAAAVAAARALRSCCGLDCGIKWPNDLLAGGKKLCGILCESFIAAEKRRIVIGIGVNVNTPDFPPELREIAISVRQLTGKDTPLPALAARLTEELRAAVPLARENDAGLLQAYRQRCISVGQKVKLIRDGVGRDACALAVNDDYSLRVRLPDGAEEDIRFGEVTLR